MFTGCGRTKCIKWLTILLLLGLLSHILIYLYLTSESISTAAVFIAGRSMKEIGGIQPPRPTLEQMATLEGTNWTLLSTSSDNTAKFKALELISSIVQQQLKKLKQNVLPEDCDQIITLQCGHNDGARCGFACQVHHRIACLMVSYSLNLPLIHDEYNGWTYSDKWSDVFRQLGTTSCSPGRNTFVMKWRHWKESPLIYRKNCYFFCPTETIDYPLVDGLPAPSELVNLVELLHSDPWIWWIGQFMKYGLTLREEVQSRIETEKLRIGLNSSIHPLVGMQVRRTDKIVESVNSVHSIEVYFAETEKYYRQSSTKFGKKPAFIASDDHHVLEEAIEKFQPPEWNVYRFPTKTTHYKMSERKQDLYSIVRDLIVLSECDFIICGFSSNICRLAVEMLSFRFIDPWNHIKSLDGFYSYKYTTKSMPQKVLKY